MYEKSAKVSESVLFVLRETDMCYVTQLMASILLAEGQYSKHPTKVLPQTVLSLTMISIKFLNNVARIDLELLQVSIIQLYFNMYL